MSLVFEKFVRSIVIEFINYVVLGAVYAIPYSYYYLTHRRFQ